MTSSHLEAKHICLLFETMKNHITTRRGDLGTTSLADGTVVTKNDLKVEACGTIDELNSQVGLLLSMNVPEEYAATLQTVQRRLFAIGASLSGCACPKDFPTEMHLMQMEQFINSAPPFHGFVLPGGHPTAARSHVCRTVCRRAERLIVACCRTDLVPYMNRLSDYLFALALKLNVFYGVDEKIL